MQLESKSKQCSSRKQLVNEAADTAEVRLRENENRDVDLVSRSHEADHVWVGHNEAHDGTMSAMGKILLGIEIEYKENELDKPKRNWSC